MATPYLRHHKTSILLSQLTLSFTLFWAPVLTGFCFGMFIFHKVSYQHLTTPLQCNRRIPYQHLVAPTCHIMLHHHSVPASYLTRVPYQHTSQKHRTPPASHPATQTTHCTTVSHQFTIPTFNRTMPPYCTR